MIQEKYLKNNYPLILIGLYPLALMVGTFISELINLSCKILSGILKIKFAIFVNSLSLLLSYIVFV